MIPRENAATFSLVDGIRTALVIVHVTANLVWIGSILAVAYILANEVGTPVERGKIGVGVYRRLAVPAFVISFTAGVARLTMNLDTYFVRSKWMHAKLVFAFVVIALHHVIGGRAKRMARGDKADAGPVPTLAVVLLLSAAAAVFFVIRQPF